MNGVVISMQKRYELPGGSTLVLNYAKYSETVSIGFWVKIGSRDELSNEFGFSHFIEHMLFKGTRKRSGSGIAFEVDGMGGEINGATSKEFTYYYINVARDYFEKGIDILSDIFFNALFDDADFIKEKNVVIDELEGSKDDPEEYINDLFSITLWGESSFGMPVIGSREVIENSEVKHLRNFYRRYYCPANLVVSVSGGVDPDTVYKTVVKYIDEYCKEKDCTTAKRNKPNARIKRNFEERNIEQFYFIMGRESYSYGDRDRFPMILFNSILGGSFSSVLFQEIREKLGLCYSISSTYLIYSDVGEFTVGFSASPKNAPKVLDVLNNVLKKIKLGGIGLSDLERAKKRFYGNMMLAMESNEWIMSRMAVNEIMYGRIVPIEEVKRRVTDVVMDDIYRVAEDTLDSGFFSMSSIGPVKVISKLKDFSLEF